MKVLNLRHMTVAALLVVAGAVWSAPFTSGNFVVTRVGTGAAALNSAAHQVDLVEFMVTLIPTPTGTIVQTLNLPVAPSGANKICTNSGSATSEGRITISPNGQYISAVGYDAAVGTASVVGTSSATNARVVALIDWNGNVDTTTALTDAYDGNNIRNAITSNGIDIWTAGTAPTGSATNSLRYTTKGASTSVKIIAGQPENCRSVAIFNGQLYVGSAQSTSPNIFLGPGAVGTGLPTTAGQTATLLPGFPTSATSPQQSPYDFFFKDANTLYVADDRTTANNGGIQRWDLVAGTWTLSYTIQPGAGCRAVTGRQEGSEYAIYAITAQSSNNNLVRIVDTGAASTFTILASAGTNRAFRGLAPAPIAPAPTDIVAAGYQVNYGVETTAPGVANLQANDGDTVQLCLNPDQEDPNPVQMEVSATNGNVNPATLNFNLVCRAEANDREVYVEMFSFSLGDWVGSPSFPVTDSDALYTVAAPGTAGDFVNDGDGAMITRLTGFLGAADSPTLPCWDFNYCYWN